MDASVTDSNRRLRTRTHGGGAGVRRRPRPLCRSTAVCSKPASDGLNDAYFANVNWGAWCGRSARRVLLGETRTRGHAHSVRRRRQSAYDRKAPHRLKSSRLVSTNLLDLWFERVVKPRLRGEAYLVQYIDDLCCAFKYREDALRVQDALRKRLGSLT
jgi:hypothetical protein